MASLQEKLSRSLDLLRSLRARFGQDGVVVAWTGGKDSTVALDLWRRVLAGDSALPAPDGPGPTVRALNLDTGCKFPEILAFRDLWAERWGLDLHVVRPLPEETPERLAQDKLACCGALKVRPLARAVAQLKVAALVTGIRADENPARTGLSAVEERDGYIQANPILDWTEMDVWTYTTQRGLPYCSLYAQGYRSLGCVPCTARAAFGGERAGRDQGKEAAMDQLRALGYF